MPDNTKYERRRQAALDAIAKRRDALNAQEQQPSISSPDYFKQRRAELNKEQMLLSPENTATKMVTGASLFKPSLGTQTEIPQQVQKDALQTANVVDWYIGEGTPLGTILDLLARTEYASANVFKYLMERKAAGDPVSLELHAKDVSAMLDRAWGGLSGESKYSFADLINEQHPQWSAPKRFGVSLVLALALDPLTYIPGAVFSKPARMIKATKAFKKVSDVLLDTKFGEAFVVGARVPNAEGMRESFNTLTSQAHGRMGVLHERVLKEVSNLRNGLSKADREALSYFRQHPDEIARMKPELAAKLEKSGQLFDGLIDDAFSSGLIRRETYDAWKMQSDTYLPGIYDHTRMIDSQLPPRWPQQKPGFVRKKKFETLDDAENLANDFEALSKADSIDEMRAMSEQRGISFDEAFKSEGKAPTLEALQSQARAYATRYKPVSTDIAYLYGVRALEQASWKVRKNYVDNILETFGEKMPLGTKVVGEDHGLYFPLGNLRFFPHEVFDKKSKAIIEEAFTKLKGIKSAAEQPGAVREGTQTAQTGTRTTRKILETTSESGEPTKLQKVWEGRVRDAMKSRGFSEGEANIAIEHLASGKVERRTVEEVTENIAETIAGERGAALSATLKNAIAEGSDLVSATELENLSKTIPGITKKVPVYRMPKAIVEEMKRANRFFLGDEATRAFIEYADRATGIWKIYATAARLPFHLRNLYSNIFLAWQGGVNNPRRFTQAADLQIRMATMKKTSFQIGQYTKTAGEWDEVFKTIGVRGHGWVGSDVQKSAVRELETIIKYGRARYAMEPLTGKTLRAVGSAIEDNARIGLFIDQVKKGKSFDAAAKQVRKYLFNYDELTPFEKGASGSLIAPRRIVPFYAWLRKNSALQMEQLLTRPDKYAKYGKFMRSMAEPESAQDIASKPEYFKELMYVKMPWKSEQGKSVYAGIDLPPLEFNRLFELKNGLNINWNQLAASLHPAKALVESALNKRIFPEPTDLKRYPLDFTRAPVWVTWMPDKIKNKLASWGAIGEIIDSQTGEKVLGMDKKALYLAQNAFPVLAEAGRIGAVPVKMSDERPEMWKRSYLTGVTQKALDRQQQILSSSYQMLEAADNIKMFAKQHGRRPNAQEIKQLVPDERTRQRMNLEQIFK